MDAIAVIDHEPGCCLQMQAGLDHRGYTVRCFHSMPQALQGIRNWEPDLVLLSTGLPRLRFQDALAELKTGLPDTKFILLAGVASHDLPAQAEAAGADALLSKPVHFQEILEAISLVNCANRRRPRLRVRVFFYASETPTDPPNGIDLLSQRQKDVLLAKWQGLRAKDIAEKLKLTDRTVHNHLQAAYRAIGAHGQKDAFFRYFGRLPN